jgi:hypothetical protein
VWRTCKESCLPVQLHTLVRSVGSYYSTLYKKTKEAKPTGALLLLANRSATSYTVWAWAPGPAVTNRDLPNSPIPSACNAMQQPPDPPRALLANQAQTYHVHFHSPLMNARTIRGRKELVLTSTACKETNDREHHSGHQITYLLQPHFPSEPRLFWTSG